MKPLLSRKTTDAAARVLNLRGFNNVEASTVRIKAALDRAPENCTMEVMCGDDEIVTSDVTLGRRLLFISPQFCISYFGHFGWKLLLHIDILMGLKSELRRICANCAEF